MKTRVRFTQDGLGKYTYYPQHKALGVWWPYMYLEDPGCTPMIYKFNMERNARYFIADKVVEYLGRRIATKGDLDHLGKR